MHKILSIILIILSFYPTFAHSVENQTVADELGWVSSYENRCGGYYLEQPLADKTQVLKNNQIEISSNDSLLFALHGTPIGEGKVTITRLGQQIIGNKAYLYRDPITGKYNAIEFINSVTLRQPDSLVIAKHGLFNLKTNAQSLQDILYRTAIYHNLEVRSPIYAPEDLYEVRKIYQLSAWGQASNFTQKQSDIYEFSQANYSTCPPDAVAWQVSAQKIELNKTTGRGIAKYATVRVRGVPIFYAPYLNFPLDSRRQTGFLWPTFGNSSKTGFYLRTPFYWNLAPNYDTTLTAALLSKRGVQLTNLFRYLTPASNGKFSLAFLPHDKSFEAFKTAMTDENQNSTDPVTQGELHRLQSASLNRTAVSWQNSTRFNEHWSNKIDYNYVSDDYYLRDLSTNVNQVTQNQLLQQAELNYQGQYWKFLTRLQAFQTLHPIDEIEVQNQYSRAPQFAMEGNYPEGWGGFEYLTYNELTRFDIRADPGNTTKLPIGNRLHLQPGIAWPVRRPDFYFVPQVQLAMTQYELGHVLNGVPQGQSRVLPIVDMHSGLYYDRHVHIVNEDYRQTLEPQIYYTYVPYRNQTDIPLFDTTVNTLNYDELFTYNRFSGLDRIGDANQISVGVTTRFIDQRSGFEKVRAGFGQILYFANRRVTLCGANDPTCTVDTPAQSENTSRTSPLSGVLTYHLNPLWSATANSIWNPQTNRLDNQTVNLHYQLDALRLMNLGYTFVRDGDQLDNTNSGDNLSQTDFSFSWPIGPAWSAVGRWTQNWNRHHFQNLLYGLQYDSCCWAVRFVGGRAFTNLSANNTYQYNTAVFVQIALKGLGTVGTGDPSQLLNSSVSGYQTKFGQDF